MNQFDHFNDVYEIAINGSTEKYTCPEGWHFQNSKNISHFVQCLNWTWVPDFNISMPCVRKFQKCWQLPNSNNFLQLFSVLKRKFHLSRKTHNPEQSTILTWKRLIPTTGTSTRDAWHTPVLLAMSLSVLVETTQSSRTQYQKSRKLLRLSVQQMLFGPQDLRMEIATCHHVFVSYFKRNPFLHAHFFSNKLYWSPIQCPSKWLGHVQLDRCRRSWSQALRHHNQILLQKTRVGIPK